MIGIDISSGCGVRFDRLKENGIQFAIIRAGFGSSVSQVDADFHRNVAECIKCGIHFGAYWFIYCSDVEEAIHNARCFDEVISPYRGKMDMPVYIDYEYDSTRYYNQYSGKRETKEIATKIIYESALYMEEKGYYSGVYLNPDYIQNHVNYNDLQRYTLWLAEWKQSSLTPSYTCDMWQYSGDTAVEYASGKVDLNRCYTHFPSTIRAYGLNGFNQKTDGRKPVYILYNDGTYERC